MFGSAAATGVAVLLFTRLIGGARLAVFALTGGAAFLGGGRLSSSDVGGAGAGSAAALVLRAAALLGAFGFDLAFGAFGAGLGGGESNRRSTSSSASDGSAGGDDALRRLIGCLDDVEAAVDLDALRLREVEFAVLADVSGLPATRPLPFATLGRLGASYTSSLPASGIGDADRSITRPGDAPAPVLAALRGGDAGGGLTALRLTGDGALTGAGKRDGPACDERAFTGEGIREMGAGIRDVAKTSVRSMRVNLSCVGGANVGASLRRSARQRATVPRTDHPCAELRASPRE